MKKHRRHGYNISKLQEHSEQEPFFFFFSQSNSCEDGDVVVANDGVEAVTVHARAPGEGGQLTVS